MSHKYVYLFSEGNGSMRELLGGKGANLAEMTVLGMPVPQGFTVSTEACTRYYEDGKKIAPEIEEEIYANLAKMEEINGKKFGDDKNPLLVSVVIIDEVKEKKGVKNDIDLDADDMKELVRLFKAHYKKEMGEDFPSDPKTQLMESVKAVFRSWDNPRANVYLSLIHI